MLLVILTDMQKKLSRSAKISGNLVMSTLAVIVKFYKREKKTWRFVQIFHPSVKRKF